MRQVTVAATQMACSSDTAENVAKAERLIRDAAGQGANIILLQELFEGPYFCQDETPEDLGRAQPVEGHPTIAHFRALARELGVVLPISFYERAGMVETLSGAEGSGVKDILVSGTDLVGNPTVDQNIVAVTAVKRVYTVAADQTVVAVVAGEGIIACSAVESFTIAAASYLVIARSAMDEVGTDAAMQCIIPSIPEDHVVFRRATDIIVAGHERDQPREGQVSRI